MAQVRCKFIYISGGLDRYTECHSWQCCNTVMFAWVFGQLQHEQQLLHAKMYPRDGRVTPIDLIGRPSQNRSGDKFLMLKSVLWSFGVITLSEGCESNSFLPSRSGDSRAEPNLMFDLIRFQCASVSDPPASLSRVLASDETPLAFLKF